MRGIFFIILFFFTLSNIANAKDFFKDLTFQILDNAPRLSYGVSVSDVNQDNQYEFVVTGFGFSNLALSYQNGKLVNINKNEIFDDTKRKTIGVAACDIDQDGYEEIYFLNTDTYSGNKRYSDRLLDFNDGQFTDLFELEVNQKHLIQILYIQLIINYKKMMKLLKKIKKMLKYYIKK